MTSSQIYEISRRFHAWKSQWSTYLQYCDSVNVPAALPASSTQLSMYIAYLASSLKYQSIVNYLSAVNVLHVMFEYDVTPFSGFKVMSSLKGYCRILGDHVEHKFQLIPGILHGIIAACDPDKESGFIAALLVGFFTFMSKSNLAPKLVERQTIV